MFKDSRRLFLELRSDENVCSSNSAKVCLRREREESSLLMQSFIICWVVLFLDWRWRFWKVESGRSLDWGKDAFELIPFEL